MGPKPALQWSGPGVSDQRKADQAQQFKAWLDHILLQASAYRSLPHWLSDWYQAVVELDAELREYHHKGMWVLDPGALWSDPWPSCSPASESYLGTNTVLPVQSTESPGSQMPSPESAGKDWVPWEGSECNTENLQEVQCCIPGGGGTSITCRGQGGHNSGGLLSDLLRQ